MIMFQNPLDIFQSSAFVLIELFDNGSVLRPDVLHGKALGGAKSGFWAHEVLQDLPQ
jgi:hypothetical protein